MCVAEANRESTKKHIPGKSVSSTDIKKYRRAGHDTTIGTKLKISKNPGSSKPHSKSHSKYPSSYDNDIWFDDVSPALIAASREDQSATTQSMVKSSSFKGPTRRIAIDCEFVGVGYDGKENALARVSVVNQFGHVLLDTLVLPNERVTDYRTQYSGIRPADLRPNGPARPFRPVHEEVAKLCKGRIIVGHSVGHDLKVLMISHPRRDIRDTSRYRPFRALFGGRIPSLRQLAEKVLGVHVQAGEHDSVEDARAAMRLYTSVKRVWEARKNGRSTLGFGVGKGRSQRPENTTDGSGAFPRAAFLNPLSEYDSGLPPINLSPVPRTSSKNVTAPSVIPRWDKSRNRRCSRKRQKFLQKRRQRKPLSSAQL